MHTLYTVGDSPPIVFGIALIRHRRTATIDVPTIRDSSATNGLEITLGVEVPKTVVSNSATASAPRYERSHHRSNECWLVQYLQMLIEGERKSIPIKLDICIRTWRVVYGVFKELICHWHIYAIPTLANAAMF